MKDFGNIVNIRPLSEGCTKNGGYGPDYGPVEIYRGWTIDKWTGWKGNTAIIETSDNFGIVVCPICGKGFKAGDIVVVHHHEDVIEHINCSENPIKGQIIGQWIAHKGEYGAEDARYAYASVPGAEGEYKRGVNFDIAVRENQIALNPDTAQEVLEAAREDGLKRLKAAIDAIENAAA